MDSQSRALEELEVISIEEDSDVPSWVNMSSYKGTRLETDNKGLNWDSKVNQTSSQEEDCIIVPLCTIQEISSSKESSIQGQQNITSNSHGFELDYDARLKFHKENFHGAKIYKDPYHGYVVKIEDHPSDFDPSPWVIFQGDRFMGRDVTYLLFDNPEIVDNLGMIVPVPISNDQQVLMRTLSHPPGFEPKVLPQPINQGNQAGYAEYPVQGSRTQMSSSRRR